MKYLIYIVCLLCVNLLVAQKTDWIEHKVQKGENIEQIAKKYNVTPLDIFKLNPDTQKKVDENTILLIPKKAKSPTLTAKKHTVLPKETAYSISKLYTVFISDLEKENPEIFKNGLKTGDVLIIPGKATAAESPKQTNSKTKIYHEIKPKETKYSIAKQYGITIEQLEKGNPEIATDFPIGFNLVINAENQNNIPKTEVVSAKTPKSVESVYTIKAKETLYSISNQFEVTQDELLVLNPELKEGVKEGMSIKIPLKSSALIVKKGYKDLTKSIQKGTLKKLAILLPFNLTKLDKDTINSTKARLKKDKFLNMTLDFYAGALVAIDSVRKMGLNVEVTILDSNETKESSNVAALVQQNNLKAKDAIIGPFYQNNVEKLADLLQASTVPVFSPLSKDYNKKYDNLIQTMPTLEDIRNEMFDFMKAKNGNAIAIIDPKKASVKNYISENQKEVAIVEFTDKGMLNTENLKALLVKDKTNYVILETEKTNLILNSTKTLLALQTNYDIKLVMLGENAALDYEEIPMERLVKLKIHYPSITRNNASNEATFFENNFKKKNKILPNSFATRGFDVTFDVLVRLAQEKSITETLNESATEQVENKFYYKQNPDGGFTNKGVYILFYDTDLIIKEAK